MREIASSSSVALEFLISHAMRVSMSKTTNDTADDEPPSLPLSISGPVGREATECRSGCVILVPQGFYNLSALLSEEMIIT